MAAVPEADVVITNPTHFAVALKYDPAGGGRRCCWPRATISWP